MMTFETILLAFSGEIASQGGLTTEEHRPRETEACLLLVADFFLFRSSGLPPAGTKEVKAKAVFLTYSLRPLTAHRSKEQEYRSNANRRLIARDDEWCGSG